jgi:hypothetical protein
MGGSMYEDYLMRLIRSLAEAVARIMGLRTAGKFQEARTELELAYQTLLGSDALLFFQMDSRTGAMFLSRPDKMAALADLLHEEAELSRAEKNGDPGSIDRRSLEYALEAFLADPGTDGAESRIRKFAPHVRVETLDQRYREALGKILR